MPPVDIDIDIPDGELTLEKIRELVDIHYNDNPTHGAFCACMDGIMSAIRRRLRFEYWDIVPRSTDFEESYPGEANESKREINKLEFKKQSAVSNILRVVASR